METRLRSHSREVVIGGGRPTVLIGERINPAGKSVLSNALCRGDLSVVAQLAREQVEQGADVLDVNVAAGGVDERVLLPRAVEAILAVTDVPLCIDSSDHRALRAALRACPGKALVNSVTADRDSMSNILPLVKEHGAAVIALPMDERGPVMDVEERLRLVDKILKQCESAGIPAEDVVIDCLALSVAVNPVAGRVCLETAERVRRAFGVNLTVGAGNVSFTLPSRPPITNAFLAMAIAAGVNCPVLNVAQAREGALAADVVLGLDRFAMRYIKEWRKYKQEPHFGPEASDPGQA